MAKALFLDLPFSTLAEHWDKYVECPKAARLAFEDAKGTFLSLLDQLIPGQAQRSRSPTFFASELHGPIMRAADSMTLIRIRYDGITRLAEPYELAFKVRKDRVGREYLYLYDLCGGRNHGPGLKSFPPDKVQWIENTNEPFQPRYEVALRQAGSAELISTFSRS